MDRRLNIRVGYLSLSKPSGGVRASCPACCSYIYLVKVWQHITLGFYYLPHSHTFTPFNKRTHRAQFSHPCQYPKARSQRARMLKAEIQKLMRDWMTVHHSVTRSTHKPWLQLICRFLLDGELFNMPENDKTNLFFFGTIDFFCCNK